MMIERRLVELLLGFNKTLDAVSCSFSPSLTHVCNSAFIHPLILPLTFIHCTANGEGNDSVVVKQD